MSIVTEERMNLFDPILAGERGVFASNGDLFKGAVFGRDSLEVAEDLVVFDDKIPKSIIRTIASLQGLSYSPLREEEPGKIHHEHRRRLDIDISHDVLVNIFKDLSSRWGGDKKEFTYYGTVDATPLFVRLVGKYVERHGEQILFEEVPDKNRHQHNILSYVHRSADWLEHKIATSSLGLIEFQRLNPLGIENQVWKDSKEGYIHINGQMVNHRMPVAPLEVQGYTYDALLTLAELLEKPHYSDLAENLKKRTINNFWVESESFFAQAIDRDQDDMPRQVLVPSSNEGLLLDSKILDTEPEFAKQIVKNMTSNNFLTSAGIRCRSLEFKDLVPYADYHGSYAIWPKETSDIARGMLSHGFIKEGLGLSARIIDTFTTAGEYYELFYVDENDNLRTPYDKDESSHLSWGTRPCIPEPGQAWSISAFIQALHFIDKYSAKKS